MHRSSFSVAACQLGLSRHLRNQFNRQSQEHPDLLHNKEVDNAEGRWQLAEKHFFNQRGARLTALDYHKASRIMVVAFSSGIFDIYQVKPLLHSLSKSTKAAMKRLYLYLDKCLDTLQWLEEKTYEPHHHFSTDIFYHLPMQM